MSNKQVEQPLGCSWYEIIDELILKSKDECYKGHLRSIHVLVPSMDSSVGLVRELLKMWQHEQNPPESDNGYWLLTERSNQKQNSIIKPARTTTKANEYTRTKILSSSFNGLGSLDLKEYNVYSNIVNEIIGVPNNLDILLRGPCIHWSEITEFKGSNPHIFERACLIHSKLKFPYGKYSDISVVNKRNKSTFKNYNHEKGIDCCPITFVLHPIKQIDSLKIFFKQKNSPESCKEHNRDSWFTSLDTVLHADNPEDEDFA